MCQAMCQPRECYPEVNIITVTLQMRKMRTAHHVSPRGHTGKKEVNCHSDERSPEYTVYGPSVALLAYLIFTDCPAVHTFGQRYVV